jgi:hypothetical protein
MFDPGHLQWEAATWLVVTSLRTNPEQLRVSFCLPAVTNVTGMDGLAITNCSYDFSEKLSLRFMFLLVMPSAGNESVSWICNKIASLLRSIHIMFRICRHYYPSRTKA